MSTDTVMPERLGRYEIVKELGRGAMGVVYEGRDPKIGRRVAIKTAKRELLEGSEHADELLERFLREARAAGNLNHPNIVTIYDADEENGVAYIAMEYIQGQDLSDYMDSTREIPVEEAVELCATVCEALHVAHENGVVHRDIKPANIMMLNDAAKSIRLTDFGIAHLEDSDLTSTGAMIGTPHYMSPEQFQGKKVEGPADLFSVAVMLYEMVTNEKPFGGEQLSTVMQRVTTQPPVQPKHLNPYVSTTLDAVILKALSKSPMDRYRNGNDMAAALRECLKEVPDPAITKVNVTGLANDTQAATMVGGSQLDATMPAGNEATVPGTTAPGGVSTADETVAGSPQQPAAASTATAETIPGAGPAPFEEKKKPLIALIGGGVGVAAIAVVAYAVFGMGGGAAAPGGSGENPDGDSGAASTQTLNFSMYAFETSDPDVATAIQQSEEVPYVVQPGEDATLAAGAEINLFEDRDGEEISNATVTAEAGALFTGVEIDANTESIWYTIKYREFEEDPQMLALKSGKIQDFNLVILKD